MKIIQILSVALIISSLITLFTSCDEKEFDSTEKIETIISDMPNQASEEEKKNYKNSSALNDTDVGMRNIKIDDAAADLTHEQKLIREYFDRDYLSVEFYDDLQRYPDAYEGSQVYFSGTVKKVIKSNKDSYELLLHMDDATATSSEDLIYVYGNQSNIRIIQGDKVFFYGRYKGINNYTIDGISYSIPTVSAYRSLFADSEYDLPIKFEVNDIKKIASAIFGEGIETRLPNNDNEKGNSVYLDGAWNFDKSYIVQLENQTNSKFDKFRFYTQVGYVSTVEAENSTIIRSIEFSQDLKSFLVISYDYALSTAEIVCYDNDLQRIWSRNFENVISYTNQIPYDYTKNNVYLAVNNRIYTINMETGEDTYPPMYIGTKTEIRKISNGILAFSNESIDSVMLLNLQGNIIWTTTIPSCLGIMGTASVQIINDRIIAQASYVRELDHVLVIDKNTGELVLDCLPSIHY